VFIEVGWVSGSFVLGREARATEPRTSAMGPIAPGLERSGSRGAAGRVVDGAHGRRDSAAGLDRAIAENRHLVLRGPIAHPRWKATLDFCLAVSLVVVVIPVCAVVAILVRLTSRGPVIFRQERVGKDGKPFTIYKFRTMVDGAPSGLASLLNRYGCNEVPLFKVPGDPRITPLGRVLRKLSIDELPQLCNVLKGDMSLVGPRPQTGAEVQLYDAYARQRLLVKPGLTGLWQVSGRSNLEWNEAVHLDIRYVRQRSPRLDTKILLRTISVVLSCVGAR
jgi:lipopolysaccharide/colanic/teichoic acid biosynthesis glycosyltransferase